MNECKIYYGLSGSFKGTTILNTRKQNDPVLWSEIKQWKSYETGLFIGQVGARNDINYAMLHLCNLDVILKNIDLITEPTFYIERGVTDMDFYHLKNAGYKWWLDGEDWIRRSVEEELRLLRNFDVKKILLIQNDSDFVRDVIFTESTRAHEFTGVEDYMIKQKEYIDFTKKYNKIDEEIIITDAEDYIKKLGVKFNKNN